MAKSALYEKRPYLLASIVAAIAYYLLRDEYIAGVYLALIKGAAVGLLAIYAMARLPGRDTLWIASVMGLAALADIVFEFQTSAGGLLFFLSLVVAIGLFLTHRRANPTGSQKVAACTLLLATPIVSWSLSRDPDVALYGLALGGMAGSAWISRFSRYHVGIGAVLFVAASFLTIAGMGAMKLPFPAEWLIWPLYYCGQFLICTGVIQTLRRDHQA